MRLGNRVSGRENSVESNLSGSCSNIASDFFPGVVMEGPLIITLWAARMACFLACRSDGDSEGSVAVVFGAVACEVLLSGVVRHIRFYDAGV